MQTPIYVRAANDHTKLGIVVTEHVFQTPVLDENTGETRIEMVALLGVCWEAHRVPAIDYCYPRDLEWLAIDTITNVDEDDEDDEEYEDEDEETDLDEEFEERATAAAADRQLEA